MGGSRELLHRLLDYIREQAKEVDPRAFHLSAARGFIRRREDIATLPGLEFDLKVPGDHVWLRVHRLEAAKPPALPASARGLLRVSDDPDGSPPALDEATLQQRLEKAAEGKALVQARVLETRARAVFAKALEDYTLLWASWAAAERPRRRTISLYGELFALRQALEAEETARPQELVWGMGIASWMLPYEGTQVPFEYPLLTQALEISLDETTMALELRPRATETRVESDAFVECRMAGASDVEREAKAHLARNRERPVTPFESSSYVDILKLAAGHLDSKGRYIEVLGTDDLVPPATEHLVVTDAWVLLARPRSNNYLFEDLTRLQEKLEGGCDIPSGPAALVTPPSVRPIEYEEVRFRGLSSRGSPGKDKADELYFPLPYNEEQVAIVQRLENAPGVCVQGPPGTGKTHTIANIVCHYLATGRRVLVTSRGEPALEVLQAKIPDEVRTLTVALLAGDREGVRQFQASIEAIQHQVSQLNPKVTERDIKSLASAIDRTHSELATIDGRVDEIALTQLSEVEVDGQRMRAQKLAELLVAGRECHAWFDDDVALAPAHAPPFSEEEADLLRRVRRKLGNDLVYANARIPSAEDLPSPAAIAELHGVLAKMKTIEQEVTRGTLLPLKATTPVVLGAARELLGQIEQAIALVEELAAIDDGWPLDLRVKCRQSSFAAERAALEALFAEIDELIDARSAFMRMPVTLPDAALRSPRTLEAVFRAATTGKPFGLIAIGASEAKEHIEAVRVAGLPPSSREDWAHVHRFVALHEQVVVFLARWNQFSEDFSVPRLAGGVAELRRIEVVATASRKAHGLATKYDAVLPKKAEAVFDRVPTKELTGSAEHLRGVREQLVRHLTRAELARATTQLGELQAKLAGKSGPVSATLHEFVTRTLGNPRFAAERVGARYAEMIVELRRIAALSPELSVVRDFAARLHAAGAPKLATRVCAEPADVSGEDRVFPVSWREAWNWARIRSHLESIESRAELVALSAHRRDLEAALAKLYHEIVAKAAWLATKRNSTPRLLQALAGYATAIRRIGQGTGPNATRYRRDAREAMLDAASAVPCWIMSHARISEAMPADIGAFDLVIVDEASQSDLWALPAILRGRTILVVGDDKQVSPDAGFISAQKIQDLKHRFLTDQPYGTEMTPEKSLYDLAARVFAAGQVMLREHFRCVPPVIAYSNRVFYKGGIQPIRIPSSSERIEPPLVDVYVPSGRRNSRDCNDAEAQAIAEEIERLLADERFAGRTIGVVSILGMDQAKHIDAAVRRRCSATELLHRRFECGDARTFQGSERHIMFLSLVVDSSNCKAISGNLFDQRFNVAASRARDRMYLVRSVNASDLSDKDLRQTLLSHFAAPLVVDEEQPQELFRRCESGFEQEVFKELSSRGYRVIPQVRTGAHRIDLVVEGTGDARLAVECDGDELHGPERWTYDMSRQRVLERAGWAFWRCFASTWILRKEEILEELLDNLGRMGIKPAGAIERAPSLVERRIWQPPEPDCEPQEDAQLALSGAVAAAK